MQHECLIATEHPYPDVPSPTPSCPFQNGSPFPKVLVIELLVPSISSHPVVFITLKLI